MRSRFCCLSRALVLVIASASALSATDYYVSPAGSDINPGTSPADAWATTLKVNDSTFAPGDRILFEGGEVFADGIGIYLDELDSGTSDQPLVVSSWGSGRATIDAGGRLGFYGYNLSGVEIRDIDFVGPADPGVAKDGIALYADLFGGLALEYIRIENVEVSGFGSNGISIGSWAGDTAYRDVVVSNVLVHDNVENGIVTFAENWNANRDITVSHSTIHSCGSGIALGEVDGATLEWSVVHDSGPLAGIWVYNSNAVTVQHNESYDNRAEWGWGGAGLSLEDNTTNSVLQYNYTHGNEGPGLALMNFWDNLVFGGNTVRYNISQNDARQTSTGALWIEAQVLDTEVHNNTIYLDDTGGGDPVAIAIRNEGSEDLDVEALHFRNNILQTTGGLPLVDVSDTQLDGASDLLLQGNDYFSSGGAFSIQWGADLYPDLDAWRQATGAEKIGAQDVGMSLNPALTDPGNGPTFDDATLLPTLEAYKLAAGSPLVNAGLDLAAAFGVEPGPRDFYGTAIPQDAGHELGAHEYTTLPVELLRADLSSLRPPDPPLASIFPLDPAQPWTSVVLSPFVSGESDPDQGILTRASTPLALYRLRPPQTSSLLLIKNIPEESVTFSER